MANVIPTPHQWWLERIGEHYVAQGAPVEYFDGLKEDECVFSDPVKGKVVDGEQQWFMGYVCEPRGYKLQKVPFTTGKLITMLTPKADPLRADVNLVKKPNLYLSMLGEPTLYLVVGKDQTLEQALDMTGYRFEPSSLKFNEYNPEDVTDAHGYIEVSSPIVEGVIFYVDLAKKEEAAKQVAETKEAEEQETEPTEKPEQKQHENKNKHKRN